MDTAGDTHVKPRTSQELREPAQILEKAKSVDVTEKDPVTLECVVAGTPELKVKWLKDGKQIVPSRYFSMSFENNVASFRIQSVMKQDSGQYTFKVENDFGSSSYQDIPPSFTKKLTKMDKILGSSIRMECKVSGSLPISAQWFKDGKEVSTSAKYRLVCHENTVSLEVNNLELEDTANYTCKVSNVAGDDACSVFLLTSIEPPSFLVKPERQQAIPDSTVEFKAVLKGTPPFKIKWFKDDVELASGPTCFIGLEGSTSFLNLYSVDASKTGQYTCQVTNDVGSDSCTTMLLVTEPPKFVKKLEASKIVKAGDSARLECKITGSPEIRVVWYRNEHELQASDKYRMTFIDSVAVLQMNNLGTEDSGDFICEAQNPAGSTSCSTKVIVKEPPVFSSFPPVVETLKNTEVSLECELSGTPPFEVIWYKDKRQLRSSKKYKIASKNFHASIHILNVETSDIGEYHCKAQNEVGSDTCICTVKLKEPPRFVSKLNSLTVVAGEPAELQAYIEGKEEVIRESENIRITFVENVATLQFAKAEPANAGKYICQIKNDGGMRENMATLTVLGWYNIVQ
uniref:Ig-like domain-containing protein n=1 Tax=Canis lupus familiaris TaxID=9615 RepID=A0A8C0T9E4_CANLF